MLSCNVGYHKPANFSRNCDASDKLVCQLSGTTSIGDCLPNNCTIANVVSTIDGSDSLITHGQTVYCATGYSASSGVNLVAECQNHNELGILEGAVSCQANNCSAKLNNGSTKTDAKTADSYIEIFNNLTCNKGYSKPLNSSLLGFLVCNINGQEKILGDCLPKTCAIALNYGSQLASDENNYALKTGSDYASNFAKLTCSYGYQNPVSTLTNCGVASASEPAPLQYIAPYAGVTIAEEWMANGKDVLIVYDDKHLQNANCIFDLLQINSFYTLVE
jgi:hypothetical protein